MSDETVDALKQLASDFRYGSTVVGVLIIGLLLLVYEDLAPPIQDVLVPSMVVYTLGSAVIACIQTLVTASANTKALAEGKKASGIPKWWLVTIILLQVLWLASLITYNAWRGIL